MGYDILIIGGGIVGCATARELSRYRLRIGVVDKEAEVGFGTTKANSGIIHGGHHAPGHTLKGRLEWAGNQRWDTLCAELGFGFRRIGELTVARNEQELATLERLLQQGKDKSVPGLEIWDQARLRREEPNLAPDLIAGLHAPTTGVINPYEACYGLFESAVANGVEFHLNCRVTGLARTDSAWRVHTNRGTFTARLVVNAAGLFADEIAQMAQAACAEGNTQSAHPTPESIDPPRLFTISPRKGEEYLLDKRLMGLVNRVIFPCPSPVSKGILVIPTFDGTIMVGPTAVAVTDKTDLTTTAQGEAEVFAAANRLVPGIGPRDCIAAFAGLRAAADGEDFIIRADARPGLIHVAGIQSPGLTAAPAIAEMVVELVREAGLELTPRADFQPHLEKPVHFATLSTAEQAALAQDADGRPTPWARLVCRCEVVTEAEVRSAIDRGATTLDGIKFRTRAGMGRCQGAFCTSRCMELLAQAADIPIETVTKHGGASVVVVGRMDQWHAPTTSPAPHANDEKEART